MSQSLFYAQLLGTQGSTRQKSVLMWNLDASGRSQKICKQIQKYIIIDSDVLWMELNWVVSYARSSGKTSLKRNLKNEGDF